MHIWILQFFSKEAQIIDHENENDENEDSGAQEFRDSTAFLKVLVLDGILIFVFWMAKNDNFQAQTLLSELNIYGDFLLLICKQYINL